MSIKIMAKVWELKLHHSKKLVLLALADHADHDGDNIYPSVPTIAWKTGYTERQVQRIIAELKTKGILVENYAPPGRPKNYSIDLSSVPTSERPRQNVTPDTMSGVTPLHQGGDTITPGGVTFTTERGDMVSPKPSTNHQLEPSMEPSEGADAPAAENAPPAPAPSIPEKPGSEKKPRKQPDKAPQLHVFRAVMGKWPRGETEEMVIAAVGDRTAEQIQPYLAIWVAQKYDRWNIAWLTEWSVTGVPARITVPEIYRDRVKINAAGPPAISNPKIHPGWAAADKLAAQIREDEKNGYPGGRPVSLEDIFGTVPKLREGKQPGAP